MALLPVVLWHRVQVKLHCMWQQKKAKWKPSKSLSSPAQRRKPRLFFAGARRYVSDNGPIDNDVSTAVPEHLFGKALGASQQSPHTV